MKMSNARKLFKLSMSLGLLAGVVSNAALADERLISDSMERSVRGNETLDLLRELRVSGMPGRLNSLILVAASRGGRGQVEVVLDGMSISVQQVGTDLQAIQVPVGRDLRRELRDLRVRTRGNITIAMMGATVDDGRGRDRDTGPQPPFPPGPGPGPQPPVPQPPFPPGPGPQPPLPPGPGPVPLPPYQETLVSDADMQSLLRELSQQSFDSGKVLVLRQYANYLGNKRMMMDQLARVLSTFSFDDGKLDALRILRPMLIVELPQMQRVLDQFSFSSNRDQARAILMTR